METTAQRDCGPFPGAPGFSVGLQGLNPCKTRGSRSWSLPAAENPLLGPESAPENNGRTAMRVLLNTREPETSSFSYFSKLNWILKLQQPGWKKNPKSIMRSIPSGLFKNPKPAEGPGTQGWGEHRELIPYTVAALLTRAPPDTQCPF